MSAGSVFAPEELAILLVGPPGTSKTLIARSMPSILPRLTVDEALDITDVYRRPTLDELLIRHHPFRAPHHIVSYAGLIGGRGWPEAAIPATSPAGGSRPGPSP